jgi:3-oxoacyl-[acyl-carrier protein] reductase
MELGIEGRWALVGGASKGLGFGCASALAHEGVNIVMVARTQASLESSALGLQTSLTQHFASVGKSPPHVIAIAADITTETGRAKIFDYRKYFDILVTNAGGPPPGNFRTWDRSAWLAAIDANMLTPIELIKSQIDHMCAQGFGRVVNITSSAVKAPIDILGLSNGARSGLTGFVAGLARSDIAAKGVTINNLLPGIFDTDRLKSNFETVSKNTGVPVDQVRNSKIAALPAKRLGQAQEFGQVCAFLCSAHASYMTGQNILLDGGSYPGTY